MGLNARQASFAKVNVQCHNCKLEIPHMSGMKAHFESKHPKEAFPEATYEAQFQAIKTAARVVQGGTLLDKSTVKSGPKS